MLSAWTLEEAEIHIIEDNRDNIKWLQDIDIKGGCSYA